MSRNTAIALLLLAPAALVAQAPGRQAGTVKSVDGSNLTLTTAAGTPVTVAVPAGTPVLQMEPGKTDLKAAAKTTLSALSTGDRVLVTTLPTDAGTAMRVIVIKSGDIAARNEAQAADWQRRGTSGIVRSVNGSALSVSVGARTETVDTSSATVFRRYADDSVKFQDAHEGKLAQIVAGDQISVRGDKSADGSTIQAEEVVTGSFENLSGLLTAVDAATGTLTLKDLATKKTVTVKVTGNSDLRALPAQAAAMFAARSRGGAAGGNAPAGAERPAAAPGAQNARSAGMDLSRMLGRLPAQSLSSLHPGEAVMIVASNGGGAGPTAITLLSGVEPLLSASPSGADAITLSPWSLASPEAGAGGSQ